MAGRLSDAWLDELRSRLNIVDVVSEYVALKPKGRRYWGLCPFHNEKTASFSVSADDQMYYCFGCHKGGSIIQFVMEMERMEFMDAVTLLAERAQLALPERSTTAQDGISKALRERLYEANLAAARYFHAKLWTDEGAKILTYLHKRGLDDGAIRRFGLGAAGPGWEDLAKELSAQGFTEEELTAAGLVVKRDTARFDMFRDRAIFPIIDAQGRILGFGGRAMGDAQPKYLNTPDTPVFNKRKGLYAMNLVKKERGIGRLVLVEGYMDVVSLRRAGVQGVVATLGTALTEEQARLMKRFAPEVWVAYDGDSAGQKAILRALDILQAQSIPARVLAFPEGMDPDDFIRREGPEGFERLEPMDPVLYRMERAADGRDLSTQEGRTQYAIACCEMLRSVRNPVELENYLSRLMIQTGFAREVLISQMGVPVAASREERRVFHAAPRRAEEADYVKAERTLILMQSNGLLPPGTVMSADFETPLYRDVFQRLCDGVSPAAILDDLEEAQRLDAVRALNDEAPPNEKNALAVAEDCLRRVRGHRLEKTMEEIQRQLETAQGDARRELMTQLIKITQEMDRVKSPRKEWTV